MLPSEKLSQIGRAIQDGVQRVVDSLIPPPRPRPRPVLVPAVVTPRRPTSRRSRY